MLFSSIDFAFFLPIVFILYWFVLKKNLNIQNVLIVVASYIFYGWWNWMFLSFIFFSTVVDYFVGLGLSKEENQTKRKLLLWTSIIVNLGFLGVFKYYNFFIANFITAFSFFGSTFKVDSLNLILPVGISFYTFQTLSYSIDVYKRKLAPTKDFIAFSAFVSFFPQLVAGPIERAAHLLPQFYKKRSFDYYKAADGMRQVLWGLFKKVVIADNCAEYANMIFNNSSIYSGSTLILGAVFFTFQIYGDFSGYSDIAIGTSRLFGFDLKQNFAFPYFSRSMAEFWRRWHISLTTWFKDYLYIPIGGSRGGTWKTIRNTFIVFIVSGFWHGANWTFIAWGMLNAIYFLPILLTKNNRNHLDTVAEGRLLPSVKEFFSMLLTFVLAVIGWIFFRAESITHAYHYILGICNSSIFHFPEILPIPILIFIAFFLIVEWINRSKQHGLQFTNTTHWVIKWSTYLMLSFMIAAFFGKGSTFIYFQF